MKKLRFLHTALHSRQALSPGFHAAVTVAVTVRYARHSENAGKAIFTFPADSAGRDLSARLFEGIFHAQALPS